ncbi:FAD-dependent monooxygenase [Pseudonocardia broussonetiae]|uniref:3-hydroxybenzoate 6-hydroxylase n=1 Tax=Pseudonocardia broussonetiae TaxID=2736640 RepID=A0A6M6JJ87_9PSEU|nr:FAD-dependent monooxygenase [Pseudonocardia broussonetiae]QJY48118.1 3-hydroxybenzoate 6-hydroxylase [Pseudonocardia broussonetiae]
MTTTHRPGEVLVLGGGIGGLATALSIARGGGTVRVLEQAPEFVEIGAGLQVGANATRVLGALGVLDAVEALAVHPQHGVLLDARTGQRLTALTLGDAFRRRYGYPYIVVHRSDLLAILLDACRAEPGVTLENDRAVVDVVNDPDGLTAVASCADGARYRADVVIGADGLRSRARRLLDTGEPVFSGYAAYRGTVPVDTVAGETSADDVLIWIGPGRHLVQYPVRRGELYNQVAVFDVGSDDPADGTPAVLRSRFADSCPAVLDALELLNLDRSWPMFDREPIPTWVAGRVALLGDAAHPMLQYLAQGAGQALEDADQLARALAAHRDDLPAALKAYEERRLARAGRCQRVARPWGRIWHTDDDVTAALRDRVLRGRAFDDYSEVDWLYADPYPDVPAATTAA